MKVLKSFMFDSYGGTDITIKDKDVVKRLIAKGILESEPVKSVNENGKKNTD